MAPPDDPTLPVREILRHVRRAEHELRSALDIGGYLRDELVTCVALIRDTRNTVESELQRLRREGGE